MDAARRMAVRSRPMTRSLPIPLMRGRVARAAAAPRPPKPRWLRVRAPGSSGYLRVRRILRRLDLRTVCEEAGCPNIGECWHHGTATFMILGDVCTRSCGYCNVIHGAPGPIDRDEPQRVADAIGALGLAYAVVTSVDRDDLPDGGASVFAAVVREIRRRAPDCRVELLIPDFAGRAADLERVLDAGPDVLNHNVETVERLYRTARPGGRYRRALGLLERARRHRPATPTKSGIMVGLGETRAELRATLADLRGVGCAILTIGQYLQPSAAHLPVERYYHPDEFADLKAHALALGFRHVESGPLVRSSYRAHEQADACADAGPG